MQSNVECARYVSTLYRQSPGNEMLGNIPYPTSFNMRALFLDNDQKGSACISRGGNLYSIEGVVTRELIS